MLVCYYLACNITAVPPSGRDCNGNSGDESTDTTRRHGVNSGRPQSPHQPMDRRRGACAPSTDLCRHSCGTALARGSCLHQNSSRHSTSAASAAHEAPAQRSHGLASTLHTHLSPSAHPRASVHLRTSTPPHLRTSTPPHLHTSAPPHLRTSAPPHLPPHAARRAWRRPRRAREPGGSGPGGSEPSRPGAGASEPGARGASEPGERRSLPPPPRSLPFPAPTRPELGQRPLPAGAPTRPAWLGVGLVRVRVRAG